MAKGKRQIRVVGDVAYVPLTQGFEAIVDAADVPKVAGWNWCAAVKAKKDGIPVVVYAMRKRGSKGAQETVLMHREIRPEITGLIDHKNRNGLDNRKANLRAATQAQNVCNRGAQSNSASGIKGVQLHPETGKWRARIAAAGRRIHLGMHATKEEAQAAYAQAALVLHGEFARAS